MITSYFMDVSFTSEQRRDRLQAAEEKLLLQQAGVLQRGWLARQMCNMLFGAGHVLANLGQRLIRYANSIQVVPALPRMPGSAANW